MKNAIVNNKAVVSSSVSLGCETTTTTVPGGGNGDGDGDGGGGGRIFDESININTTNNHNDNNSNNNDNGNGNKNEDGNNKVKSVVTSETITSTPSTAVSSFVVSSDNSNTNKIVIAKKQQQQQLYQKEQKKQQVSSSSNKTSKSKGAAVWAVDSTTNLDTSVVHSAKKKNCHKINSNTNKTHGDDDDDSNNQYADFDIESAAAAVEDEHISGVIVSEPGVVHLLAYDGSEQSWYENQNKFEDIEAPSMVVHSKNSFEILDNDDVNDYNDNDDDRDRDGNDNDSGNEDCGGHDEDDGNYDDDRNGAVIDVEVNTSNSNNEKKKENDSNNEKEKEDENSNKNDSGNNNNSNVNNNNVHDDNVNKIEKEKYPSDCYSFLSIHGPFTSPGFFCFGMMPFVFQSTLSIFMILSVVAPKIGTNEDVDNPDDSFFGAFIPADVMPLVQATQFITLLAYVVFADSSLLDITTAVNLFPRFSQIKEEDKSRLIVFSSILRGTQGILATIAAYLLVITSNRVIDIVLNFTA